MSTQDTTLPPLPRAAVDEHNLQGGRLLYTRDQMQAYARAAIAAQAPQADACGDSCAAFEAAFMSENGFHTKAELAVEWDKGLSGVMFRAGIQLAQQAQGVPAGMALVPLRMTQAMNDVTETDGWQWEDLLAAAEAITEEEYNQLAAAPQAEPRLNDFDQPIVYDTGEIDLIAHALTGDEGEDDGITILNGLVKYLGIVHPGKTMTQVLIETEDARAAVKESLTPQAQQASPTCVWIVESKTFSALYATKAEAEKYIASLPITVSGGMSISAAPVIGAQQAQGVPAGMALVPLEATPEMTHAGRYGGDKDAPPFGAKPIEGETAWPFCSEQTAQKIYRAMLAAAPQAEPMAEADAKELRQWRAMSDPAVLYANLLRGLPARLSSAQLKHLIAAADAAPQAEPQTPHVGESCFESWFAEYSPANKSDKQRARDAYAAGMAEPQPEREPERKPLTDAQIEKLREQTFSTSNPFCPCDSKTMRKAVWAAERAHGIGTKGGE